MFHRENEVLRSGTGIAVPGATIIVYVSGTDTAGDYTLATKATIYAANVIGAPLANSAVITDENGSYGYYVPDGVYDEVLTYGAITEVDVGIQMFDLASSNQSVVSAASVTPTFSNNLVKITAQATSLSLENWSGAAVPGWSLLIRIKDNGTPQSISFGTKYRPIVPTLPTTTTGGKLLYLSCIYNADDDKFDVIGSVQQA